MVRLPVLDTNDLTHSYLHLVSNVNIAHGCGGPQRMHVSTIVHAPLSVCSAGRRSRVKKLMIAFKVAVDMETRLLTKAPRFDAGHRCLNSL